MEETDEGAEGRQGVEGVEEGQSGHEALELGGASAGLADGPADADQGGRGEAAEEAAQEEEGRVRQDVEVEAGLVAHLAEARQLVGRDVPGDQRA